MIAFVHSLEFDDWDREIATDDAAGKLDFLKEQAQMTVRARVKTQAKACGYT